MKYLTYIEVACAYNVSFEHDKLRKFNQSTHVVTNLFSRLLNSAVKGLHKIRIELSDAPNVYNVFPADDYTKIAHFEKSFDFAHYFAQPKLERRKIILETLYEAIVAICEKAEYDLTPFTIAYEKVKELNFENRYVHDKLKFSPNRKYKAGIQVEVDEEAADISIIVEPLTPKGELLVPDKETKKDFMRQPKSPSGDLGVSIPIFRTHPHHHFIYQVIHKGKWVDSETFVVSNKDEQIQFVVSIPNETVQIEFAPKTRSREELKEYLDSLRV